MSDGTININSKMRMPTSTFSNEILVTTLYKPSQTNTVLAASSSIPYPDVVNTLLTNSTVSILSAMNATSVTHSTANFVITASPHQTDSSDNNIGSYIYIAT